MKTRNSTIEILRIIFMLFIVLFHFLGRNYNLFGINTENALWDAHLLPKLLVHATGQLGVPGFVFISGYFGLKFNTYRFIDLIVQCVVYSLIFFLLAAPFTTIFGIRELILSAFFLSGWWFIWSYIVLYFISPALNEFIDKMSKTKFILLIGLLVFISTGLWVYKQSALNIFLLLEIYFIARFTKIHLKNSLKSKAWIVLIIAMALFYGTVIAGYFGHNLAVMPYVNSYYNPLILVLTGSLIVFFEGVKFSSKVINWISPNILAVYLITESFYGSALFSNWFLIANGYPILLFVGIAFALILLCVLVDKFRLLIMDKLQARWAFNLDKWLKAV